MNNKIKNKKICFLGVTFKANTDDMRESSSTKMIPYLSKKGAKITYFDPTGYKKEFKNFKNVFNAKTIKEACNDSDLIIIHTEWNDFKSLNFEKLNKKKNFFIYDMRNILQNEKIKKNNKRYFGIGK